MAIRVLEPDSGLSFDLTGPALGTGGEAAVYRVPGRPALAAKIYYKPTLELAEKLAMMLAAAPADPMARVGHASIAWPRARLQTAEGRFAGFVMPRIDHARSLPEYYVPKARHQSCPFFHYGYLLRTARNLASTLQAIHDHGYVVGDVSGANVFVNHQALVTLLDVDSFQVRGGGKVFRCRVGTPEYTPPELQSARFTEIDRTAAHDSFGLAVLVFQLLMQGTHPFAGVFTGAGEPPSIPRRIQCGHWPYGRGQVPYAPNPNAPPWGLLTPTVQDLFLRCFDNGQRQPERRPSPQEWHETLRRAEKELVVCRGNRQHYFPGGLGSCPWCVAAKRLGRDPFPSEEAVKAAQAAAPGATASIRKRKTSRSHPTARVAVPASRPRSRVRSALTWIAALAVFVVAGTVSASRLREMATRWSPSPGPTVEPPMVATVTTSLPAASGRIRQFAFDGNVDTYFLSSSNPSRADHFTLTFDRPTSLRSVVVATGRPDGSDRLDAGMLEVSGDGKAFEPFAEFAGGMAHAAGEHRQALALRIRPGLDLKHPLAIREITIESVPHVPAFKHPVEFAVDVADAPEMKAWADHAAGVCERAYPLVTEELKSEGFAPPTTITLVVKKNVERVAAAADGRITCSAKYFETHPDDLGPLIYQTAVLVQAYRGTPPNWLSAGIAAYVRYFKYEGKLPPLDADKSHYNGRARATAAFLAYVAGHYDRDLVRKLNASLRAGRYSDAIFEELTGKPVAELDQEWRGALRKRIAATPGR